MATTKTVVKYRNRAVTKRKRRRAGKTIPLSIVAGVTAGMYYPARYLMDGNPSEAMRTVSRNYTGYDPVEKKWHIGDLKQGLFPLVCAGIVHKLAGRLGINRMIGKTGIPFIRV